MRPIISYTVSLMHPIGVWTDSKFQQVASKIPDYFKYSKVLKEQLTTMDIPPETMLLTADSTSMYTNIQTCTALNQTAQYFNRNNKKYRHLPVDDMVRALHLMMENKFHFGDIHWIKLKVTDIETPPVPAYATVFYNIFELFLL